MLRKAPGTNSYQRRPFGSSCCRRVDLSLHRFSIHSHASRVDPNVSCIHLIIAGEVVAGDEQGRLQRGQADFRLCDVAMGDFDALPTSILKASDSTKRSPHKTSLSYQPTHRKLIMRTSRRLASSVLDSLPSNGKLPLGAIELFKTRPSSWRTVPMGENSLKGCFAQEKDCLLSSMAPMSSFSCCLAWDDAIDVLLHS